METSEITNPYVGPAAFRQDQGQLFFGREREAKKLLSLISADEVVLFYAPSGAGKTSLINARIIPGLKEKGVEVLPVARVSGEVPSWLDPRNVFVFNLLSYLSNTNVEDADTLEILKDTTLREYLERKAKGVKKVHPQVIILDQFEEVMTTHLEHREEREEFFYQVREALESNPLLSLIFVMRDDHIASLDRYTPLLPGHLSSRFRMERLRREAAIMAVRCPAERADRPFDENVAEMLVDNLCQERLAEREMTVVGEFVEPVQLQVVCYQLWENIRSSPGDRVTREDLEIFGDVDRALESYYDECIRWVTRQTKVKEARIRRWFGQTLITPSRIRGQVSREPEASGGLPNESVLLLLDEHLIRAERVRGGTWYELVHDRFIDPILSSNKEWLRRSRRAKRRRLLAAAAMVGLLFAVALFSWTRTRARRNRIEESRTLASAAIDSLETGHPQKGLWQARRAVELTYNADRTALPGAEKALHQALFSSLARLVWSKKIENFSVGDLSKNGKRLATASYDGNVRIWQTSDDVHPTNLPIVESEVVSLALSTDGRLLAVVPLDDEPFVWNVESASLAFRISGHGGLVNTIAFSPGGSLLATGSEDATGRIWDAESGMLIHVLAGHTGAVSAVAFSWDGRKFATASEDETVKIWDMESGNQMHTISPEISDTESVAFSPHGKYLVVSGSGEVSVWHVASGERYLTFHGRLRAAFSPEENLLLTVTEHGAASLLDMSSIGRNIVILPDESIQDWVDVDSRQNYIAAFAQGGIVKMWKYYVDYATILRGHTRAVHAIAFSPDGKQLTTVGVDETAKLWEVDSGKELSDISAKVGPVENLAFSPGGNLLAVVGRGNTIGIWDTGTWRSELQLTSHGNGIEGVEFSSGGNLLTVFNTDGTFGIWDVPTGEEKLFVTGHEGRIRAASFSPEEGLLSTVGDDAVAKVWDVRSFTEVFVLAGHSGPVYDVAFSPDGQLLATGSSDKTVKVWDMVSGSEILTLIGHTEEVQSVDFSPDASRIATGSGDRTVRIWNVISGEELFRLPGSTRRVYDLAFSPDGRRLAIASEAKTVRLEFLHIQDLLRIAEERMQNPSGARNQEKDSISTDLESPRKASV